MTRSDIHDMNIDDVMAFLDALGAVYPDDAEEPLLRKQLEQTLFFGDWNE